jgi:oligopeptide transport system substrate-binding protein
MPHFFRRAFPYFAIGVLLAAMAWAMSFGTLPQADFTFQNGNECETLDPGLATGQPEHRVINGLFEGLLRHHPPKDWQAKDGPGKNVEMLPQGGMATHFDLSEDGRTYTFHMRPEVKWTDGSQVTAEDFEWSWMRMLHPETASRYANLLYDYVAGGDKYNSAIVEQNSRVEIELADRPDILQLFPRGTMLRGVLQSVEKPPEPQLPESASAEVRSDAQVAWKRKWLYAVDVKDERDREVDWQVTGKLRYFAKDPAAAIAASKNRDVRQVEKCLHVLPDFSSTVGIQAEGPQKFVVTLKNRTAFFPDLVAFYPLFAVNRRCFETHGSPNWTKPENIVTNGPFRLEFRRIRDRIRMVKNPTHWDAANVHVNVVDALAMKSETTALNMYLNGQLDWVAYIPVSTIPKLQADYADQFRAAPVLIVYMYRINVTRPELKDKRVRRALNLALDKQAICDRVLRAGELPAETYVPPGMAGYVSPPGAPYDVEAARKLLAEAGYPGGRGLPTIEILYNDLDKHRTIAEAVQQMWRDNLGIDVELRSLEWGVYLDSTHKLDYDVARAGWVADYPDPNTFLDMFMTGNENNQTGWSNATYDDLVRRAAAEPDAAKRMSLLKEAEMLLLEESPILPVYFYISANLVHPRVEGFFNTVQDEHPLDLLRIKKK